MRNAKPQPAQEAPHNDPRRGYIRPLADDAMGQAAAALAQAGFADPTLVTRWAEFAGAEVAQVAEPVRLQEGPEGAVLTLKADPAAAVFLQHESRALIERLNGQLGAARISRLKFVSGNTHQAPEMPSHPMRDAPQSVASPPKLGLKAALDHLARIRQAFLPKTPQKLD